MWDCCWGYGFVILFYVVSWLNVFYKSLRLNFIWCLMGVLGSGWYDEILFDVLEIFCWVCCEI